MNKNQVTVIELTGKIINGEYYMFAIGGRIDPPNELIGESENYRHGYKTRKEAYKAGLSMARWLKEQWKIEKEIAEAKYASER